MKERRFRIITANVIISATLALVLAAALFSVIPDGTADVPAGKAVYSGDPDGGKVSLMVNVYEGTEFVEQIATLLAERGWSTTFFVGGKWGFELGNHGYLHRDHATLSADNNRAEILITERLLAATLSGLGEEAAAAAMPRLFAPPSGSMGSAMFEACDELGYTVVMWTRDTIDWRDHDAALITQRATKNLAGGDLILMHPTAATAQSSTP